MLISLHKFVHDIYIYSHLNSRHAISRANKWLTLDRKHQPRLFIFLYIRILVLRSDSVARERANTPAPQRQDEEEEEIRLKSRKACTNYQIFLLRSTTAYSDTPPSKTSEEKRRFVFFQNENIDEIEEEQHQSIDLAKNTYDCSLRCISCEDSQRYVKIWIRRIRKHWWIWGRTTPIDRFCCECIRLDTYIVFL